MKLKNIKVSKFSKMKTPFQIMDLLNAMGTIACSERKIQNLNTERRNLIGTHKINKLIPTFAGSRGFFFFFLQVFLSYNVLNVILNYY